MTVMLSRCIGLANLDRRDLKRYADGGDASVPTASVSLSSLRTRQEGRVAPPSQCLHAVGGAGKVSTACWSCQSFVCQSLNRFLFAAG